VKRRQLTCDALADMDEIISFLADDHPVAAAAILERLERAFERLARFPGLGHTRPDLTTREMRFYAEAPYVIVYRVNSESLVVLRVLHAARDVQAILDRE
jgi:plasmid stabilization system protein ParE